MERVNKKRIYEIILGTGILCVLSFHVVLASEITKENVIKLVNEDRAINQAEPLLENENLSKAAKEKADDMIKNNYFAHNSPQKISPWYWFEKNNYNYAYAGENLAINFSDAEHQQEAWMRSPTHRKNILNKNYREIGVVVERGVIEGHEGIITVQFFGTSDDNPNEIGAANGGRSGTMIGSSIKKENEKSDPYFRPGKRNETLVSLDGKTVKNYSLFSVLAYEIKTNPSLNSANLEKINVAISLIFILAIILANTLIVSRKKHGNPFMAMNVVILTMMFTAIVFWKM